MLSKGSTYIFSKKAQSRICMVGRREQGWEMKSHPHTHETRQDDMSTF